MSQRHSPTPPAAPGIETPLQKPGSEHPAPPSDPEEELPPSDPEEELPDELPPTPTPPRTEPSENASLRSVEAAIRTLTALHQANMQAHEQHQQHADKRIAALEEMLRGLCGRVEATADVQEDHMASLEDALDRLEDVTAAHVRMLQESSQPQQ